MHTPCGFYPNYKTIKMGGGGVFLNLILRNQDWTINGTIWVKLPLLNVIVTVAVSVAPIPGNELQEAPVSVPDVPGEIELGLRVQVQLPVLRETDTPVTATDPVLPMFNTASFALLLISPCILTDLLLLLLPKVEKTNA